MSWVRRLALLLVVLAAPAEVGLAAPPDIVVGAPNSLTGGLGEAGRYVVDGLTLAVKQVNAGGGIKSLGGAMLRVIPADTSSDNPAQAASVTRRLITESGAVVLVGSHGSTMTLSAQIEAERAGVPILTTSYADQIVQRGYRFTFKLPGQAGSFARANIDYLRVIYAEAGRKLQRVAVFYGSDAGNSAGGKAALDYLKTTSLEIVAGGAVPANLTDPTPVVGPVLASKPDLLIANLFTPDLLLVIHALRAIGVAVPVLTSGSGVSVRSVPQALGAEANGFMGTIAWADDLPIAGVADFKAAFLAAYPGQTFAPQEAGEGYAIGQIIAAALEQAASTDPARIRDALAQISVPTIMPGGPVEFDANGLNKHAVPILVEWEDGVLRSVWPKDYQVAKPLLD